MQHIFRSYFKTLSIGPVQGLNPRPPAMQSGALQRELTKYGSSCKRTWICYVFSLTSLKGDLEKEHRFFASSFETDHLFRREYSHE